MVYGVGRVSAFGEVGVVGLMGGVGGVGRVSVIRGVDVQGGVGGVSDNVYDCECDSYWVYVCGV